MTPEQLAELQGQIQENNVKLATLIDQNKSIMDLLKGNPLNANDRGMLGEIQKLHEKDDAIEKRITKLEKFKDRMVYVGAGMGLVGGWGITDLLGKIFSKH
jgi:uncharacterized protein YydD (DUF2326 family)